MSAPVQPGVVVAGKYRVEHVIGTGAMGVVVAAHHLRLDKRVAIKFLLPHAMQSGEAVARFAREARAAAKIHNEHVVQVSDVDALPDGTPFIVMEHLEGNDLVAEIQRRGPLSSEEAVDLILQALEAMAEAHALGIVHRDLKPANLFLARRRSGATCLKVLDFGISRMSDGSAAGATVTGTALGTPFYMAPEQWISAKHADARSDIWSLGAILYHLIAGSPPFLGDSIPSLWHAIANEAPRSLPAGVPPALEAAIARCLQKTPDRRFSTADEMAAALRPLGTARAAGPHAVSVMEATGNAYTFGTLRPRSRASGLSIAVLAGIAVSGAVAVGAWRLAGERDASEGASMPGAAASSVAPEPSPPAMTSSSAPSAPAMSAPPSDPLPAAEASSSRAVNAAPTDAGRAARPLRPAARPTPAASASRKKTNADTFD